MPYAASVPLSESESIASSKTARISASHETTPTFANRSTGPMGKKPTAAAYDGTRDTSVDFQRDIDGLLDRLVAETGLSCLTLPADTRVGWVGLVLQAMDLPGQPPQLDLFV